MTVTAKALFNAKFAANSDTTEYTATAVKTIIDKFTATNTDVSARTISIYIVPSGGSVSDSNLIIKQKSISAAETYDFSSLQNQILNTGDYINVIAEVSSKIVIRASGREIA